MNNNLSVVNLLLKEEADVNAQNKGGSTPLHLAAYRDLFNIVKELIDNNAGVNERDSNGNTPLHLAAYRGLFDIVKELIDNNANVNKKNSDGNTPLHLAAYKGHFYVVEELVERGANMEIEAGNGKTPLELARENNASEVVDYLEKKLAEQRGIPVQRKRRHHHGDHPRHHREERSIYLESKGASHSIENVDSAIENNQAASGASKSSSWTNAFAHVVDVVKGVSQFISSPFKPAIDMEHFQPYGVDVVKSLTEKGTDFNSPKGSTESPALLTSGERNNHTVTAVPEISATLVNNILISIISAVEWFNKTQHKQPIHENLLSPIEQSMRLNNIDVDMIIRIV